MTNTISTSPLYLTLRRVAFTPTISKKQLSSSPRVQAFTYTMTSSSFDVQRPSSSSSSSSFSPAFSTPRWNYDVFLSFSGEDVRNTFVAHLDNALRQRGIKIYIDAMLRKGDDISPTLLKAIEESKISIIILSKNYALSTWCLEELMKILECKETKQQMVLPVFYKIDPSEVRKQTNNFEKALADLENRFKNDVKVQRWREALTKVANLSGFHWKKERKESEFIHEIVQWVSRTTARRSCLYVAKFPVGIESRVQDIISLLSIQSHDMVLMIGILGIGGIGKTTLAKAVYNAIYCDFDGSCFLGDIQTESKKENGNIARLQEILLLQILGDSTLKVHNEDQGISEIKNRLGFKKVLLILDDVGESKQLEKLVGACDWFGLGSRIIVTTRDKHLLNEHGVDLQYMAKKLDHNEAFQLFSWHAFHRYKPDDDLVEVTRDVLWYAKGLPLVLTVLGSDLYGSDVQQWKSALESYKEIPNHDIQEILRRSYDRILDYRAKQIFLDIACFFIGADVDYIYTILDNCRFSIKKLIDKCLISVEAKTLRMHDLLRDMGREVVRQESNEPGERSRLWFHEDIRHVLEDNTGTNKVEGIVIELPKPDLIHMSSEVFKKMTRLRLFINRNACFSEGPNFLSNKLRVLNWPNCPLQELPSDFRGENLVALNMRRSLIKEFKARISSENLTSMDFRECKFLQKIPDLSNNKNLTHLRLDGCINLVKVHDSVGFLQKLLVLSVLNCSSLSSFPSLLKLPSLSELKLSGCLSLKDFPKIGCEMNYVKIIKLERNGTYELPPSFGFLTGLREILISQCQNLTRLPSSILNRPCLSWFVIYRCPNLKEIGNQLGYNGECSASTSAVLTWENKFSSPAKSRLASLSLFGYSTLSLSGSGIVSLHASIKRLVGLRKLELEYCEQLQEIVELPLNIEKVYAGGCKSLESFPEVVKRFQFNTSDCQKLNWIDLSGCHKMHLNIENHVPKPDSDQSCYDHSWGIVFPGNKIPDCCFSLYEEDIDRNSYKIQMERKDVAKIKGILVCAVIPANTWLDIAITVERLTVFRYIRRRATGDPDHVLLQYLKRRDWEYEGEACYLRISITSKSTTRSFIVKNFGAYLIRKNEESGMCHDAVHVHGEDIENRGGKRPCITKFGH